ncbi:GAP family protein [Actinophytocola sp.]|uniref:GAP family protein n=1 Tax=Actinophytocola sp. TaxID=1872138 RepID=UPI002ED5D34B
MSVAFAASLAALALLDSTSVGTLFVPVVLMLSPGRPRVVPILYYLATITVFYLTIGVLVALGGGVLRTGLGSVFAGDRGYWLELAAGVALFALSFRFDPKRRAAKGKSPTATWTERVHRTTGSRRALIALAIMAGTLEVATMFPYLGAIAMLAGVAWPIQVAVLAVYCVVMVLPALLLLALRTALSERVTPILERANTWFQRHATSATGWILAIVGFLLVRDAAYQLGFFAQMGGASAGS